MESPSPAAASWALATLDPRGGERPGEDALPTEGDRYADSGEVLGVGGLGDVQLVRDQIIGREVALKTVKGDDVSSDSRARFIREACVQGQLEHPAIVPVYDLGETTSGEVFFTMKRIRGRTLRSLLDVQDGATPLRRLLSALSTVCLAIDFAHKRGVLHRDLKPENVMLGDFGEVYVLDWGIASAQAPAELPAERVTPPSTEGATLRGAICGTPGYIAPEIINKTDDPDVRVDVFSLGQILFEILTRQHLHVGENPYLVLSSTLDGQRGRAIEILRSSEAPPELAELCLSAIEVDRADRPGSVSALHEKLERYLDGDRDATLRRDASARHAQAALQADDRSVALQELGRALALDPENQHAITGLGALLSSVPDEYPEEADRSHRAAEMAYRELIRRVGVGGHAAWLAILLLTAFPGMNDPVTYAIAVAPVAAGLAAWWQWRGGDGLYTLMGFGFASCLASSLYLGPLVLTPVIVAAHVATYAVLSHTNRELAVAIIGAFAAILIPVVLALAGVIPDQYSVRDGALIIEPLAAVFVDPLIRGVLAVGIGSSIAVIGALLGWFRRAQIRTDRQLHAHAWQLRQAFPTDRTRPGDRPAS